MTIENLQADMALQLWKMQRTALESGFFSDKGIIRALKANEDHYMNKYLELSAEEGSVMCVDSVTGITTIPGTNNSVS